MVRLTRKRRLPLRLIVLPSKQMSTINPTIPSGTEKEGKNFRAYIDIDGNNTSLGTYDTAKEAAVAHDVAALQAGRPRSILNFQDSARPIPTPDPPACAFKVYVFEHLAPIASSPSVAASVSVSSSSSGISSRRVIHSFDSYKNIPAELLRKRNIEIYPLAQPVPEPTGALLNTTDNGATRGRGRGPQPARSNK